jgi:hypothetical protein
MNNDLNPYAAPRADADVPATFGTGEELRKEGQLILIPAEGASFPPRCVICNQAAQQRLRRKLFWHPPGYYALLCVGALIYVIAAMIVRKSATFEVGVCGAHASRRRAGILLGWIGVPLLLVGSVAFADTASGLVSIILGIAAFGALVAGLLMVRVVSAARIADGYAWIRVGRPFLDSIP